MQRLYKQADTSAAAVCAEGCVTGVSALATRACPGNPAPQQQKSKDQVLAAADSYAWPGHHHDYRHPALRLSRHAERGPTRRPAQLAVEAGDILRVAHAAEECMGRLCWRKGRDSRMNGKVGLHHFGCQLGKVLICHLACADAITLVTGSRPIQMHRLRGLTCMPNTVDQGQ